MLRQLPPSVTGAISEILMWMACFEDGEELHRREEAYTGHQAVRWEVACVQRDDELGPRGERRRQDRLIVGIVEAASASAGRVVHDPQSSGNEVDQVVDPLAVNGAPDTARDAMLDPDADRLGNDEGAGRRPAAGR